MMPLGMMPLALLGRMSSGGKRLSPEEREARRLQWGQVQGLKRFCRAVRIAALLNVMDETVAGWPRQIRRRLQKMERRDTMREYLRVQHAYR